FKPDLIVYRKSAGFRCVASYYRFFLLKKLFYFSQIVNESNVMKKIIIVTLIASLCTFSGLTAQTLGDEVIRSQFIKDWERAKAYTIDYLDIMPADKYSFKATDSVRSFAQQMLHLAQSNVNIFAYATGASNIIGDRILEESKTAQTKDSVMYYVVASYDLAT